MTREPEAPPREPRIAPVEHPGDAQREALAKTPQGADGHPMNVFKTLARCPSLLRRVNALGGYFVVHGSIPVREREIVILRTAFRAGSAYELAHHRRIAAAAGLTPQEIDAAVDPSMEHPWAPAEQALVTLVDELTARDTVSDETWAALAPFGDDGRLELLVLVGHYRLLAGVLNAVGVQIDA